MFYLLNLRLHWGFQEPQSEFNEFEPRRGFTWASA